LITTLRLALSVVNPRVEYKRIHVGPHPQLSHWPNGTFDDTQQWWFPSDEHTVNGVHPGR